MTEVVWREERTDHAIRDALDRRHPERLQLRPNDVCGVQEGFDLVDQMWAPTIERASRLPRPLLHERVNGDLLGYRLCDRPSVLAVRDSAV